MIRQTDYDVVIMGGGPGGCTLATMLARRDYRVLVLERHRHPRFHIGESISVFGIDHFKTLGVYERLQQETFIKKRGIEFALPKGSRTLWFPEGDWHGTGEKPWTFQMTRDKLDHVLLQNAREEGAEVREQQKVRRVLFEGNRAVGVEFQDFAADPSGPLHTVRGRWIVDATGQAALLNHQLQNNCFNDALLEDKIAVFCHMRGELGFHNGDDEQTNFRLCVHENGRDWAWFIPVEEDLVSLGVVLSRETVRERGQQSLEDLFQQSAAGIAFLADFLQQPGLELVGKYRGVKDYSYRSRRYFGDGWALVGDSAGFIDPLFSTGIQITFNSAFRLADVLHRVLQGDCAVASQALADYDRTLDRYYRVASTLTYLFYLSQMDPQNYENGIYLWKHIRWAGWKYRLRFLRYALKMQFIPARKLRDWSEEVLFGHASKDNLIAEIFYMLSQNFDEVTAAGPARRVARQGFAELEV